METVSVCCDSCGASLEFPNGVSFVTCNYCKSKLKVKQTSSTSYTEIVEEVRAMSEDVESLKKESRLERLDREWESQKELFMIKKKNGFSYLPTDVVSFSQFIPVLFGGLIGFVTLSIVLLSGNKVEGVTIFMLILSVLTILFGLFLIQNRYKMKNLYLKAELRYKDSRRKLLKEMNS